MSFMQSVTLKAIGSSFGDEVGKAGLENGISWDNNGNIFGADNLTAAQQAALQTVYENHNPSTQSPSMLKAELAALDVYIPRGLEDYWQATGFDTTKLPSQQQQRLTQKLKLRQQLQSAG